MTTNQIWIDCEIGKGLKLTSGYPFESKNFSIEQGFPLIRIRDILESKIETYFSGAFPAGFIIKKGDVLIGMDGDFHVVKWQNENALLNQRVLKIDVHNAEELSLDFIYYWLQPYIKKVNELTAATTVKHLSTKDLYRSSGLLPNPKVQKKIATILTTIDTAIEKTEALIEKYQQIKAGLMHDLFTRGVLPNGQLRPSFEQAPELYQETVLGWIPKEWLQNQLKAFVRSAQYGISTSLSDEEIGIPVLRMNNIQSNMFDVTDLKYTNMDDAYKIKLKLGDVLYNRTNSMEHVGKTAIWRDELPSCSFASYLVRINLHENSLLPEYFSHWMSQENSQNALRRYATPAVQQVNINPTNLQKVIISCPASMDEQLLIVGRIDSVDSKLNTEKRHLEKLKSKKLGLMQDLLTGKVPVNVDEPAEASIEEKNL